MNKHNEFADYFVGNARKRNVCSGVGNVDCVGTAGNYGVARVNQMVCVRVAGRKKGAKIMKKKDKATKLELAANLVKALPESSEQTALAVAAAMLAGYNMGKMAAQGA